MVVVRNTIADRIDPLIFKLIGEIEGFQRQIQAVIHRPTGGEIDVQRLRGSFDVVAVAARHSREVVIAVGAGHACTEDSVVEVQCGVCRSLRQARERFFGGDRAVRVEVFDL